MIRAKLVSKNDIAALAKKLNKKVTSNKTKHVEAEKKITDLSNKIAQISVRGNNLLWDRMYFTGNADYQDFLVFTSMLSFLTLDYNKKVTNWIYTGISSEKTKPFDTNLQPTMCKLANGWVNSKFNNFVLVQKRFSSLYSNFILNLYKVYELNNWPRNHTISFTLKACLSCHTDNKNLTF